MNLARCTILGVLLACAMPSVAAQQYEIDLSQLDPAQVLSAGGEVLDNAPDSALDGLFQAVHATSLSREESATLCALFHPDADRSVQAFQRAANRLGQPGALHHRVHRDRGHRPAGPAPAL